MLSTSNEKSPLTRFTKVFVLAGAIRLLLQTVLGESLVRRVELVNPLTSWFKLQECIAFDNFGISPYSGDLCHHPPLLIAAMKRMTQQSYVYVFICLDLLVGLALYVTADTFVKSQVENQDKEKHSYSAVNVGPLLLSKDKLQHIPLTVLSFYLLHPSTILTCLAYSTEVFNNFCLAMIVLCMVKGYYATASLFIVLASYLSLYPIMLLGPLTLCMYQTSSSKLYDFIKCILTTSLCVGSLLYFSYGTYNSWTFIHAVYGFILEAPDLTPNMGLFWYFFAEMFDHFRLFYLWVYQLNVFIYLIPAMIIFRNDPVLVFYILTSLTSIFKSYSNLGSAAVPLALVFLWSYTFRYMRNVLLVCGFLLVTPVLAPCMWHLWIYAGAGNANFFYAVTLAYNTGHIFLISDILYAFLRYRYHLKHGLVVKTDEGEEGIPLLK